MPSGAAEMTVAHCHQTDLLRWNPVGSAGRSMENPHLLQPFFHIVIHDEFFDLHILEINVNHPQPISEFFNFMMR